MPGKWGRREQSQEALTAENPPHAWQTSPRCGWAAGRHRRLRPEENAEARRMEEPVGKAVLDVFAQLVGTSFKREGRPPTRPRLHVPLGCSFSSTNVSPPDSRPRQAGPASAEAGVGEAAPGPPPQPLLTWSRIQSRGDIREIRTPGPHSRPVTPDWGRLGQGITPTARGFLLRSRGGEASDTGRNGGPGISFWPPSRSSSGWVSTGSHLTLSCLDVP